jgi:hypothetical protein
VPVTLYRIKLYGHSGGDTDLFCKNLATVLDIDEQRARTLLHEAPAIIKEGIEKAKAEEFCKLLEPIQALCIVEPLDGGVDEDVSIAALASPRFPESPGADDLKKKAAFRSMVWMVGLVGAIGVLALLVAVGFLSSFWNLYLHNQPPAPVEGPAATGTQAEPAPADAGPVSLEELLAQIDALEARIESNKFRSAQAEEARARLHRSPSSQSKDLEELALIMRDLRDQIRSDAAQLKTLKRKVQEMERSLEQR